MSRRVGYGSLIFSFVFALAICQTTLFAPKAQAAEHVPVYVGEAMANANGGIFVLSSSGERIKMNANPIPIFDDSLIQAVGGSAVVTLASGGLVDIMKGSEVKIDKYGERNFVSINRGSIRFSVNANDMLSVAIPSEGVSITMVSNLASASENLLLDDGVRAGFVELREDGTAIISSTKGSLEVSTVEGKSMVLAEGKSLMVAKAGGKPVMVAKAGGERSRAKAVAALTKNHDLIMLGVTAGIAATVVVVSSNTDSGDGWVASSP